MKNVLNYLKKTKVNGRTESDGSSKVYGMKLYQNDQNQRDQTQRRTNLPGLLLVSPLGFYYNPDHESFIQYPMGHH